VAADQAEKQLATGENVYGRAEMQHKLTHMARNSPYYKRNLAHICSFFVKGECTRGDSCPYRHEMPDHDPELNNQNIKDRYYGKNDPVANKLLGKINARSLVPPSDQSIKTLFISGVTPDITEQDFRNIFYPYGELTEVKIVPRNNSAFITYSLRAAAEKAAEKLYNNLVINDTTLKLAWGRSQILDANLTNVSQGSTPTTSSTSNDFFGISSIPTKDPDNNNNNTSTPKVVPSPSYAPPPPMPGYRPMYPSMNPSMFGTKTDRNK